MLNSFELVLKEVRYLTPKVIHLAFARTDGEQLPFIPGQFITFLFTQGEKIVRRSYSLSSIPGQSDWLEIAVSPVEGGFATGILFHLQPGDLLTASGPFGRLILPETIEPVHYVLGATGTGVSPYRAMIPQIQQSLRDCPNARFTLLLGVQYRHDLLYLSDFLTLMEKEPRFTFRAYLSRETTLSAPYERQGYLQTGFAELTLNPATDLVYLCGNPNMIDQGFALLKDAGFAVNQIKREKYI